jgi:hypothetical protein
MPLRDYHLVFALGSAYIQGNELATMTDLLPVLDAADAGELEGFEKSLEGEGLFGFVMGNDMKNCLILFIRFR